MHVSTLKICILFPLLGLAASKPRNVPVRATSNTTLGTQYDLDFNNDLRHDGSIFAKANGYTMQVFMDSITYDVDGNLTSFVSNSVSYVGLSTGDPRNLTTLGRTKAPLGEHVFAYSPGMWPLRENESVYSAFWPEGSSATLPDNKTVVMFSSVLKRVPPATCDLLYNTMLTIEVVAPDTINKTQLPPLARPALPDTYYGFWWANEPQFGSFSAFVDQDHDYMYALACDKTGVKIARAALDGNEYISKSGYRYWDNSTLTYTDQIPIKDDNSTNIFNFDNKAAGGYINSGKVYWSYHHNTYVALMLNNLFGRRIWASYSITGLPEGPWAEIDYSNVIYTPYMDPRCVGQANGYGVYAFDASPYGNGDQSMMITTSACAKYTVADLIHFA